nr:hypothetical protein CFP56_41536 [Quercus suber]
MELPLRECVQAFSFEDSYIGNELTLFVYSEKDNKEAKPSTLITRLPIIGEFSPKWDWGICPPNLPQWSQATLQNVDASATLLLAFHHTNIANFFKSHRVANDELGKPMMTRYFGVSYEALLDEVSARDRIWSGKDFFWHGTSFKSDLDLTFEDNGGLSVLRLGYFMSLRSGYLSLRCEDHCVVKSYSPHRFSRRFGFYQNIPGDLKKRIQTSTLKELYQYYQSFTHSNTSSIVLIPSSSTNFEKRVTRSYMDCWKNLCKDDFTKGTDTLAKTALLLAKPPSSKSWKGKKEQATMSPSHQL